MDEEDGKLIRISFEKDKQRAAAYDGSAFVGFCEVQMTGESWTIVHTEVESAYGGRGIAKKLIRCVCEQAEKEKADVVPVCTYAKKVLE
ncbi:GNAT family N-acetyltransferase [Synergistes jonesii]|uniref:GNAT family N-acetyltransferase n=1 Tax=Synergistes jonesii TaxID=2754 RepID=UPI00248E4BB4|nr:GNAT family N-acetyltransferase [Synergistes jonesii]